MVVNGKKYLLEELKKNNLPSTYKSLLKWENKGIIPKGNIVPGMGRVYSNEEVEQIILLIKEYIKTWKRNYFFKNRK